jgi:hypothetical protein
MYRCIYIGIWNVERAFLSFFVSLHETEVTYTRCLPVLKVSDDKLRRKKSATGTLISGSGSWSGFAVSPSHKKR